MQFGTRKQQSLRSGIGFEVLTEVVVKSSVFWNKTSCSFG
jgi:hypothetical protein